MAQAMSTNAFPAISMLLEAIGDKALASLMKIIPPLEQRGKVFISYSWDSEEHCRWVCKLASKLLRIGIDVQIDKYDTRGGQDLAGFMAENARSCPFVICICSDKYLEKSRGDARNGVKYETELIRKRVSLSGSSFVIPIIKNNSLPEEKKLPDFLPNSKYFDFNDPSDDCHNFSELFARLINLDIKRKPSQDVEHNQQSAAIQQYLLLVQRFWDTPEESQDERLLMQEINLSFPSNVITPPSTDVVVKKATKKTPWPSAFVMNLMGRWNTNFSGDQEIIDFLMGDSQDE